MKSAVLCTIPVLLFTLLPCSATAQTEYAWRRLRASRFALANGLTGDPCSLSLAPNNGWAVTKRHVNNTVHVVYTAENTARNPNEREVFWRYTTNEGLDWSEPEPISKRRSTGGYGPAWDGVIAKCIDSVGVAYTHFDDGDSSTFFRMRGASGWKDPWRLSSELGLPEKWTAHPSLAMGVIDEVEDERRAFVLFQDSTRYRYPEDSTWGRWISHRYVDIWDYGRSPDKKRASVTTDCDYPSVAAQHDCFHPHCVWQAYDGNDWELHYVQHQNNPAPQGADAVTDNGVEDVRPSLQVWETQHISDDDTLMVAWQRHPASGHTQIWFAWADEHHGDEWHESQVLGDWQTQGGHGDMRHPNLWVQRDTAFLVFVVDWEGLSSQKCVALTYLTTPQGGWLDPPLKLSGYNCDSTSVYGHDGRVYPIYRCEHSNGDAACYLAPLAYTRLRAAIDRFVPGTARVLQQLTNSGGWLFRGSVLDDTLNSFIAVDRSTDNGATWQDAFSPGWGEHPTFELDQDSVLVVVFGRNDSLFSSRLCPDEGDWLEPVCLYEGGGGVRVGQTSVSLYPDKSAGVKVAAITFPVYDLATQSSMVLFAKVDTGRVVLDTIAVASGLGDSFPCINVHGSDSLYVTWQHGGDSVVSSYMTGFDVGTWTQPESAWSSPDLLCASGTRPMSVLEGDFLRAVWREERSSGFGPDEYAIGTASMDLGGAVYSGWNLEADPSEQDTLDKTNPVYAGAGVTVWQQKQGGVWNIVGEVRGDTVTLFESDSNSLYPHAVAESSAISPSVSQVRVKVMFAEEILPDTCELRFVVDSLNVSNAGADATADNNGTKLMRKAGTDSLFAVYTDADGATIYAWSATGDSWARSVYAQGRGSPAIAEDGTGRRWVVTTSEAADCAYQNIQARYRCGDTWSLPQTIYTWPTPEGTLSTLALAGGTDGSTPGAYCAFVFSGTGMIIQPQPVLVAAKFDGTNLVLDSVHAGSVSFPCIAAEPGASGDYLSLAWQQSNEVYYTRTGYEVPAGDWADTLSWEAEVNLSNSGATQSCHPFLAADGDRVAFAWAEGSTPDVYLRCRSTDSSYDSWETAANVSSTGEASDNPVITLDDSLVVVWEEHVSGTDSDVFASVECGEAFCLANTATGATYPHAVFHEQTSGDSTIAYINAVWSEAPGDNYYEVRYLKYNLTASGGGQQSGGEMIQPLLYSCRPNPFTGRTAIRYQFPREGRVRLQVFDVTGRTVRTLQDGQQKPGVYTVNWNGCDDRGQAVARGVYFYHLAVPGFEDIKKAVVMR